MRTLIYDLMSGQNVIKSTSSYNEAIEWEEQEGHWHKIRFKEVVPPISKEQEEKRKKRLEKIAETR